MSDVTPQVTSGPASEPASGPASRRARTGGPLPARAEAWRFPRALREATAIASLSPSSHNCQPWALARLTGDDTRAAAAAELGTGAPEGPEPGAGAPGAAEYLALGLDRTREIGSLAAHAVEMRVSCGAYWQLLLAALEAQGWSAGRLRFFDADDDGPRVLGTGWPRDWTLLALVELHRAEGTEDTEDTDGPLEQLRTTAAARRTNRAPYREDPVEPALLERLTVPSAGAAQDAPVTVTHLWSPDDRKRFGDFVARHGGRDFSHGAAWRETHSFLRRSATEAEARGDGFTLEQLFGPLPRLRHWFLRTALSPRTMTLLRWLGYHRLLASQLAVIVRRTPVITAMHFTTDTPGQADMVRGGARLADYWLRATREGLALHPVSVVIQHDDLRQSLGERFRLRGRPFFVSRLGRPTATFPPAPRHPDARTHRSL
ncbi:RedV protein [Streptomyces sp. JJ36]|uniref:RedV protein n=1 Tax=Streptomyces sp. JJ36 TaxID=2736645 RepID=UPI001F4547BD|nr:RedV protein [Streptomyces sp. JJ36]MCF6526493.1 RedV protein [Streptomyces sp. JJ36]